MDFLPKDIAEYSEYFTEAENDLLKQLNRDTHLKVLNSRMLSGHLQGRTLAMFSQMLQPQRILEIGTYTGYSALCLAEGLAPDGKLITLEANEELASFIQSYLTRSELKDKIELKIGQALDIIPTLNETFDLVFIDADKKNNANYYDIIFDKIRPGGYIIADNVLWSGKVTVALAGNKVDKDTQIIHDYNQKCLDDPRTETLLLPIRDGMMICRKL